MIITLGLEYWPRRKVELLLAGLASAAATRRHRLPLSLLIAEVRSLRTHQIVFNIPCSAPGQTFYLSICR